MPSAPASVRFSVAARTSMPKRVRLMSSPQRDEHERAEREQQQVVGRARRARSTSTAPVKPAARGPSRSSGPQTASAASRTISTMPNVAASCRSSGAAVDALQQQRSISAPIAATASAASSNAAPEAERTASERFGERPREVRAQHVERAVREIDDARDAEDQRQAGGDEKQRRRPGEAVQELREQGGGRHAGGERVGGSRRRRPAIASQLAVDARHRPCEPAYRLLLRGSSVRGPQRFTASSDGR